MGTALIDRATARILGWQRWGEPDFDPATQAVVDVAEPPDAEALRWDGATGLRSATQPELDAAAGDALVAIRAQAKAALDRQAAEIETLIRAVALVTLDDVNLLRSWLVAFQGALAAATNLADLKTRVAGLPATPDRTATQLRSAIKAKIDAAEADA